MIETVAWAVALCASVPMLVFAIECLLGLPDSAADRPARYIPSIAVLIPAHDEAAGIARTIAAAAAQLRPQDRLIVIADNCTDATAVIAARSGAEVVVRDDPDRVGKGYALAAGRDFLRADPRAAVIMLDADCIPGDGAFHTLAQSACRRYAAVQGRYLLDVGDDASPIVRVSSFAFLIKNRIRQRGLQRLAGVALLQGTGMAMPWTMFDAAPLASASLVEDLELGLHLVKTGQRLRFEDAASFISPASAQGATRAQRTRWEHGTLATVARHMPSLLREGLSRPRLLPFIASLMVPPLSLLVALLLPVTAGLALLALAGGTSAPLALVLACAAAFALAIALVWLLHARAMLPFGMLLGLPLYVIWKQAIYCRLLTRRERRWVRTSRVP